MVLKAHFPFQFLKGWVLRTDQKGKSETYPKWKTTGNTFSHVVHFTSVSMLDMNSHYIIKGADVTKSYQHHFYIYAISQIIPTKMPKHFKMDTTKSLI